MSSKHHEKSVAMQDKDQREYNVTSDQLLWIVSPGKPRVQISLYVLYMASIRKVTPCYYCTKHFFALLEYAWNTCAFHHFHYCATARGCYARLEGKGSGPGRLPLHSTSVIGSPRTQLQSYDQCLDHGQLLVMYVQWSGEGHTPSCMGSEGGVWLHG